MHSRFVILEVVVGCLQLATEHRICYQYYQGLFFLIKKHLIISVAEITERMWNKIACDFLLFSCSFVASPKLRIQISLLELCIQ